MGVFESCRITAAEKDQIISTVFEIPQLVPSRPYLVPKVKENTNKVGVSLVH